MSKETVVRCDMCGAVVDDNTKGVLYRDVWGTSMPPTCAGGARKRRASS